MVLAAVAWALVGMAVDFHHASVSHIVCPEDGQTIELHHDRQAQSEDTVAPAPGQKDAHDPCSVPAAPPGASTLANLSLSFAAFDAVPYDALGELDARVSGPLRFAPKTSPPHLS
ncbi:hypothetical protein LBMAG42_50590 [Deltaproteobacteria bacterium]|nr:hypothetical protein LBMAG42_50590 [Deltaproteobacteria bacterium]